MILILILSDATYNFEICFVAMIHYKKPCIGPKTILSLERGQSALRVSIRLSAPYSDLPPKKCSRQKNLFVSQLSKAND